MELDRYMIIEKQDRKNNFNRSKNIIRNVRYQVERLDKEKGTNTQVYCGRNFEHCQKENGYCDECLDQR